MAEENQEIAGPTDTKQAHEAHNLQQLTCGLSPAQAKVCQLVAEYQTPKEIIRSCARAIAGGQITESWIRYMVSPATRPQRYRPIVEAYRDAYRREIASGNLVWRLRQRQRLIEEAIALLKTHLYCR